MTMAQEIERKFLVVGDFKSSAESSERLIQGYLCSVPERTVRIRVSGDRGFITVKGACDRTGVSRFEWEKEIPVTEAVELLALCEDGVIDKTRYRVRVGDHFFEVDEFHADNQGLTVAEIELSYKDESFEKPECLGMEVTGDARYYNSALSSNPFKNW